MKVIVSAAVEPALWQNHHEEKVLSKLERNNSNEDIILTCNFDKT